MVHIRKPYINTNILYIRIKNRRKSFPFINHSSSRALQCLHVQEKEHVLFHCQHLKLAQDNSFSIWSTFHTSGSGPGIGNEEETKLGWEHVRREKNLLSPKISTFFLSQHFLKHMKQ